MSQELYYTPPSQECFADMRCQAMKLWATFDNEYGYVDEKIGRIKDIPNVGDNFMYILAMFDPYRQKYIFHRLQDKTKQAVMDRMEEYGIYLLE